MTKYEFLDLRSTYGERLTSMSRFWLTATLAIYGAAYYGAERLDGFTIAALIFFYFVMSVNTAFTILSIRRYVVSLALEAHDIFAGEGENLILRELTSLGPVKSVTNVLLAMMTGTFVVFCFYVAR
ncbi:MAG: hypothetical protein EP347_03730 [Alphaproteobacteria bacterium]|nr:MAG: hypothetical protein EP347_03730 [Alphaproteobacteria bacterium]